MKLSAEQMILSLDWEARYDLHLFELCTGLIAVLDFHSRYQTGTQSRSGN
jgi:hypothetical protein